ncbi:MAG TPA: glycosyltransferase family 2 protein [Solirubrobacteraceae bacterium]|jgi:glycosyltransferase involved in cell wall biosynthesis|nr:glycosyltransferase family 2 protein [Solirubrobacteraceae bacterium]
MTNIPEISVVVPVYGCGACIDHLHARLVTVLDELGSSYEIILVDDRAQDGSWESIETLVEIDSSVRGILLSRNFGQHAAITAGLHHARGERVVVMDCDLQDPPEDIPRLYAKALEGHDIVFGRRISKPTGGLRRLVGRMYFRGIRAFGGARLDGQFGNFSVISRKVVDAFLRFRDQDRHYVMILTWLSFDAAAVDYQPAQRYRGRSSYTLPRLLEHAIDGVFFQTTVLLRWIVYLGFFLAAMGGTFAVYLLGARLAGDVYPGWAGIVVVMLVLGGFIILSTGITGLYIGKVFEQTRERPVFVVDRIAERVAIANGQRHEIELARRGV